ncbi:Sec-independent protein translocase protein TatB [Methylopila henanensis]|uniref:Sec-independent protein translocase protein TatB n=1 Tax=Methylopila henanensis TaxID=873516 RepID=A0ABW4K390_9HYPH
MFDIAWSEFLIVAVVALVVVGPRDLPGLLRNVGRMVATVRRMAGEFQTQFNEAMREAELDELRREVSGIKDAARKAAGGDPFSIARDELKKAIDGEAKPPAALAGDPPAATPAEAAEPAPSALAPSAPDAAAPDQQTPSEPAATPSPPASKPEASKKPDAAS